jgi:GT2 family glycosyltransferase
MELSVVLVNHNGASCLPRTLSALASNTESRSVECIVVDSGSRDDSWRNVSRHWDRARALRFEENIGFCSGCNRGAEEAEGSLLAFVNYDAKVEAGWDMPLRRQLENPSVSIATGLLLTADGGMIEAAGVEIAPTTGTYGRLEREPRSSAPHAPVDVPAASAALMMVRRSEFVALGGFYEPFFMYVEEADYSLRVPGRIVLDPASAVRHEHGHAAGPPRSPLRLYRGSRNRLLNAARHLPPAALAESMFASAAFDLLTLAQNWNRDSAAAIGRGWLDGLKGMPRERRARSAADRKEAVRRVGSLREAVAQQRRLGRV